MQSENLCKSIILLLISFLTFLTPGHSRAATEKAKVVKFGTLAPEGSTWLEQWKNIAREIEEKAGGTIRIKTYGGGVLGDEIDMLRLMKLGQLQVGGFTVLGITKAVPEMAVLELPFLFRNFKEIDYIRKKMLSEFQKYFEKRGFILLTWLDQGFVKIYSQKPLQSLQDLRNARVWAWSGEEMAIKTFEAWGIKPIPLPVPDVYMGLQAGIIDTIYTTPLACVALQWFTNINYIIDINMRYEPGAIIGTRRYWESLSPREKEITLEANKKHLDAVLESVRRDQDKAYQEMIHHGKKVIHFSKADMEAIQKASRKFWFELADKLYPRSLLEKILRHLEEYRSQKK